MKFTRPLMSKKARSPPKMSSENDNKNLLIGDKSNNNDFNLSSQSKSVDNVYGGDDDDHNEQHLNEREENQFDRKSPGMLQIDGLKLSKGNKNKAPQHMMITGDDLFLI